MSFLSMLIIGVGFFLACIGAEKLIKKIIKSKNPYIDLD